MDDSVAQRSLFCKHHNHQPLRLERRLCIIGLPVTKGHLPIISGLENDQNSLPPINMAASFCTKMRGVNICEVLTSAESSKKIWRKMGPNRNNQVRNWNGIYYHVQQKIVMDGGWLSSTGCNLKKVFHQSNPGIANWAAKVSTRVLSSTISLLLWRPFRKAFCIFPCSLCTALAICAALSKKSAIVSKSPSTQPLDVIAGVPGTSINISNQNDN